MCYQPPEDTTMYLTIEQSRAIAANGIGPVTTKGAKRQAEERAYKLAGMKAPARRR